MLRGLPKESKPLEMVTENCGLKVMTQLVKQRLLQEGDHLRELMQHSLWEQGAAARHRECGHPDPHWGQWSQQQQSQHKQNGADFKCFSCSKTWHKVLKCRFKNKSKDSGERQTNHISLNGKGWSFLTALSATVNTTDWYLDSGVPTHMSMRKDWLQNHHAIDSEQVKCAQKQNLHIAGLVMLWVNVNNGLRNITGVTHALNTCTEHVCHS